MEKSSSRTRRKKHDESKLKEEEEEDSYPVECASSSRRTRSRMGPEWTTIDCLILVNEIAAVEADCLKALSTFQKWKIVAENCTALDVERNSNQCRRKWDLLLAEYEMIKHRESKSRGDSFWGLEIETRKELGLPENFDAELFKAIDNVVKARGDQPDTDPDSDPELEAGVEGHDLIAEPGSKRQRRQPMPRKCHLLQRTHKSPRVEKPLPSPSEAEPQRSHINRKHKEEKETNDFEQEHTMAVKLRENAELICAIVADENSEYATTDSKNFDDSKTELPRHQADKVIACLGEILNTLNQLCDHVQVQIAK